MKPSTFWVSCVVLGAGAWLSFPELEAAPGQRASALPDQVAELGVLWLESPLPRFAYFPRSSFRMGSTPEEMLLAYTHCTTEILGHVCDAKHFQNEGPVRIVHLSPFLMERHEVTVAEYERCVAARRCAPVPYYRGAQRFRRPELPVTLVSWDDAVDYCAFSGARLPTEAEWERAARGRSGRTYPWGMHYNSSVSNHGRLAHDPTDDSDGFAELAPVGSYPAGATPELVFDLAGNVEEWTHDRYVDEYDADQIRDPKGPSSGTDEPHRSVRGGNYASPAVQMRGASRSYAERADRDARRGFRCAR